jgi:hypothetical protein
MCVVVEVKLYVMRMSVRHVNIANQCTPPQNDMVSAGLHLHAVVGHVQLHT